jgi:hypothetical protein
MALIGRGARESGMTAHHPVRPSATSAYWTSERRRREGPLHGQGLLAEGDGAHLDGGPLGDAAQFGHLDVVQALLNASAKFCSGGLGDVVEAIVAGCPFEPAGLDQHPKWAEDRDEADEQPGPGLVAVMPTLHLHR